MAQRLLAAGQASRATSSLATLANVAEEASSRRTSPPRAALVAAELPLVGDKSWQQISRTVVLFANLAPPRPPAGWRLPAGNLGLLFVHTHVTVAAEVPESQVLWATDFGDAASSPPSGGPLIQRLQRVQWCSPQAIVPSP